MAHDDNAHSGGVAVVEAVENGLLGRPVQPGKRFVEDEVVWLHRQRARDGDAGLFAAR
ncbi:MAG: hypothetical protein A07HN63_01337 [uncultured archaeon A07HN63]|nr:MAG: hypothetical protein A07HN63_01337 [uncultured archaeon A07HN63]